MQKNDVYIEQINKLSECLKDINGCTNILKNMSMIYAAKENDYCEGEVPMQNLRASEEFGIAAWRGTLIRMGDKKRRIQSFINKGEYSVENEKFEDTLIDLANYSLLCTALLNDDNSLSSKLNSMIGFALYIIAKECILACIGDPMAITNILSIWSDILVPLTKK